MRLGVSARGIDTASALTEPDSTRLASSMPLQVSRSRSWILQHPLCPDGETHSITIAKCLPMTSLLTSSCHTDGVPYSITWWNITLCTSLILDTDFEYNWFAIWFAIKRSGAFQSNFSP